LRIRNSRALPRQVADVFLLGVDGEREEGLGRRQHAIERRARNAMPGDDKEADRLAGVADPGDDALAVGAVQERRNVDDRDDASHWRLLV
jgi:hypothetical protein